MYNPFLLGGRTLLPGYAFDAFSGSQAALLGLHLRCQVPGFQAPVRDRLYLSLRIAAGNVWDSPLSELSKSFHDLRYGGSIGLGVDSLIGAFNVDLGLNDKGEAILYISLGGKI
jgi:outer membrane translocation and assembly module TamA